MGRYKCKLCSIIKEGPNRHIAGVGNYLSQGGYCCNDCNINKVLPARKMGVHL